MLTIGVRPASRFAIGRLVDRLKELVDDLIGVDTLGVGIEVGEDAMSQDGSNHGADIAGADGEPAMEDGPGLGGQHDVLRGARSAPQASQFLMNPSAPGSLGRVALTRSTA